MTAEKKDKWTETSLDSDRLLTVKKEEDEEEMKSYLDNSSPNQELSRRLFRQLRYAESSGPYEVLVRLRELCRCWLRPDMYTKEEILERLVMEQFLTILPGETRSWVQLHHPERGEEVVALVKDIENDLKWVGPSSSGLSSRRIALTAPGRRVTRMAPEEDP